MAQARRSITSKAQDAAQKLAHGVGRNGLMQSPTPMLHAAAAALDGHPDTTSRDLILAEIARRNAAMGGLRAALGM